MSHRDRRAWAVGCDPYCCAYDSAAVVDVDRAFELTLPREIVQFVLRELGTYREKHVGDVEIWIAEDRVAVGRASIGYDPVEAPYPDFHKVLPDPAKRVQTGRTCVNPYFMERFAKVKHEHVPAMRVFLYGELAPVEVLIGETFRAIVMPLRVEAKWTEAVEPPRLDAIPAPSEPPAPAAAAAPVEPSPA